MIIVHAYMQVRPDKRSEFLKGVHALLEASRAEEGNFSYDLYQDTEKPDQYAMVELWSGLEAAGSHNGSEHFQAFSANAQEWLAAPPEIKLYRAEPLEPPTPPSRKETLCRE